jgi:uncharacterized protein
MSEAIFHLALPTHDIAAAKRFYLDGLGCALGRESARAVTHLVEQLPSAQQGIYPRHFGLVFLLKTQWQELAEKAQSKGLLFYQQPRVRFPETRIEHHTFFLQDPSQNLLEFKHYTHESAIFGERESGMVGDSEPTS